MKIKSQVMRMLGDELEYLNDHLERMKPEENGYDKLKSWCHQTQHIMQKVRNLPEGDNFESEVRTGDIQK